MSDVVLVAIVIAAGGVIAAFVAAIASVAAAWIAGQSLVQSRQTHDLVNSRMTELLERTGEAAHAEGVADGEQAQRDRSNPEPQA